MTATRTAFGLSLHGRVWDAHPTAEAAAAARSRVAEFAAPGAEILVVERLVPVAPPKPTWATEAWAAMADCPISALATAVTFETEGVTVDARQEFTFSPEEGWSGPEPFVAIQGATHGLVVLSLTPEKALAVADGLVKAACSLGGVR